MKFDAIKAKVEKLQKSGGSIDPDERVELIEDVTRLMDDGQAIIDALAEIPDAEPTEPGEAFEAIQKVKSNNGQAKRTIKVK